MSVLFVLGRRGMVDVVRVSYRPVVIEQGRRRGAWTRFLLVPEPTQTLAELKELAEHAAYHHHGGKR